MTRRAPRILKDIAAVALAGSLSACAVYPAGGYGYAGGYRGGPQYAYAPAYRGGYGGGYGGGWGNHHGWR